MLEDKASMRIRNDVTRRKILTILKMRTRRRALKGGSDGMDSEATEHTTTTVSKMFQPVRKALNQCPNALSSSSRRKTRVKNHSSIVRQRSASLLFAGPICELTIAET